MSLGSFNSTTEIGRNGLQERLPRSSSQDRKGGAAAERKSRAGDGSSLPPGADKIMEMGFSERKARAALARSDGDASQAVEWLLSQPTSPGGAGVDSDGDDDDDNDARPPSPSTLSPPPSRKSLTKKAKPLKPQNPVFDQEAFTPVLIPAKPGAMVVASDPKKAWTPPPTNGAGGFSGAGGGGMGGGEGRLVSKTYPKSQMGWYRIGRDWPADFEIASLLSCARSLTDTFTHR